MYQYSVKPILEVITGGVCVLNVLCEVENLGELTAVVKLDGGVCDGVVLEPHQVKVQYRGKVLEQDTLLGVLQSS